MKMKIENIELRIKNWKLKVKSKHDVKTRAECWKSPSLLETLTTHASSFNSNKVKSKTSHKCWTIKLAWIGQFTGAVCQRKTRSRGWELKPSLRSNRASVIVQLRSAAVNCGTTSLLLSRSFVVLKQRKKLMVCLNLCIFYCIFTFGWMTNY